jgi:hypothetical protein
MTGLDWSKKHEGALTLSAFAVKACPDCLDPR